jgi:hypothetical protein
MLSVSLGPGMTTTRPLRTCSSCATAWPTRTRSTSSATTPRWPATRAPMSSSTRRRRGCCPAWTQTPGTRRCSSIPELESPEPPLAAPHLAKHGWVGAWPRQTPPSRPFLSRSLSTPLFGAAGVGHGRVLDRPSRGGAGGGRHPALRRPPPGRQLRCQAAPRVGGPGGPVHCAHRGHGRAGQGAARGGGGRRAAARDEGGAVLLRTRHR